MYEKQTPRTPYGSVMALLELIYHATVREVRKSHGNAVWGLVMNMIQTVILVTIFYFMFTILGMKRNAVRGDFVLYIMSGIFLFMTHIKAMGAVVGSEGPASAMMKHAPMNTLVAICSAALASLYTQVLSMAVVLFIYHVAINPIEIHDPVGTFGMMLLAWYSGVAVGMLLLSIKPWAPDAVSIITSIYSRANMVASGKMFLANNLPAYMLPFFSWNPLFHTIDQARGFAFINYNPHYSSIAYPMYVSLTLIMLGLLGEFFTRKRVSMSWSAKR
ncbi:ABC transporter permease [Vannielia litorea]|uniref:ABC-type polysaccharide/polyol phosphate export permease n=1 Tax=Vannielia litorea TaxID=1217970 RepID=A0A1N6HHM5_9RHOB|nr:ABC transporter permease [Vannielia litorea]SIO19243.1 ABC-type polysaccharide/polyol phosphate export permease [Vannielia litorea]